MLDGARTCVRLIYVNIDHLDNTLLSKLEYENKNTTEVRMRMRMKWACEQ
jgi:hypothetical protein